MEGLFLLKEDSPTICPLDPIQGFGANNPPVSFSYIIIIFLLSWIIPIGMLFYLWGGGIYTMLYLNKAEKIILKNLFLPSTYHSISLPLV